MGGFIMEKEKIKIKVVDDGIPCIILPEDTVLIRKRDIRLYRMLRYRNRYRDRPINISDLFDEDEEEDL